MGRNERRQDSGSGELHATRVDTGTLQLAMRMNPDVYSVDVSGIQRALTQETLTRSPRNLFSKEPGPKIASTEAVQGPELRDGPVVLQVLTPRVAVLKSSRRPPFMSTQLVSNGR